MDLKTGKIYDIENKEKLIEIQDKLGRKLLSLTEKQAKELKPLSKRKRKFLLRNKPCPCLSGKSFKKYCWKKYKKNINHCVSKADYKGYFMINRDIYTISTKPDYQALMCLE